MNEEGFKEILFKTADIVWQMTPNQQRQFLIGLEKELCSRWDAKKEESAQQHKFIIAEWDVFIGAEEPKIGPGFLTHKTVDELKSEL